jgi:D-xylose transport system permease protein
MTLTQGKLEPGTSGEPAPDVDLTAAAGVVEVPPEILAQSLGEYFRGWWQKLKSGDSGMLPVLVAMVIVAVVFELITPENAFLRPGNLVYIFGLSSVYMVLSMGEIVVLLLGELDLSIGAVALMGGVIAYKLVQQPSPNFPWWAAIAVSLLCCGLIGAIQGTLVARVKIPAFVVTLGGFLFFTGMIVIILGGADTSLGLDPTVPNQAVLYNLVQGNLDVVVSWVGAGVVVVVLGAMTWLGAAARRRSGLVAPPASLAAIRIGLMAAAAVAVLAICTVNRGGVFATIEGLPWVIPVVLGILGFWTVLLQRTRFGRYVYAIGGNPEAARRAGVNLAGIRTWCFVLSAATAGFAGILLGSFYYGQYSSNVGDPGQLVLYSVAAAVIGGTSLFGGRGKPIHGVLGGLLIGGIAYGVSLMNLGTLSIPLEYILPGAVLLLAVFVDVTSRRGARTGKDAARV